MRTWWGHEDEQEATDDAAEAPQAVEAAQESQEVDETALLDLDSDLLGTAPAEPVVAAAEPAEPVEPEVAAAEPAEPVVAATDAETIESNEGTTGVAQ